MRAAMPDPRQPTVGGCRLGVRLAAPLPQNLMRWTDVLGYFDDQHDDRLDPKALSGRLGPIE